MNNILPMEPGLLDVEDWSNLLGLIAIVRSFAGPSWAPPTIGLRSNAPVGQLALQGFPNTRFLPGQ